MSTTTAQFVGVLKLAALFVVLTAITGADSQELNTGPHGPAVYVR